MTVLQPSAISVAVARAICGEPVNAVEIEAARVALDAAGLPAEDVAGPGVRLFRFGLDGRTAGYGGLELFGPDALLRSIVVPQSARRKGVGRGIVDWLLAYAAGQGAQRAFLFTTDARAYFDGLGFEVIDRSQCPPSILQTRQALGLCPGSAALMMRTLTP